jgi:hypothetical protein
MAFSMVWVTGVSFIFFSVSCYNNPLLASLWASGGTSHQGDTVNAGLASRDDFHRIFLEYVGLINNLYLSELSNKIRKEWKLTGNVSKKFTFCPIFFGSERLAISSNRIIIPISYLKQVFLGVIFAFIPLKSIYLKEHNK